MKYVSTARAIIIALLFIALPVYPADEKSLDMSAVNQTEQGASSSGGILASPVIKVSTNDSAVAEPELETDKNKDKLTIFFSIGLAINILLMALFGIWAVRQWRKSDNKR